MLLIFFNAFLLGFCCSLVDCRRLCRALGGLCRALEEALVEAEEAAESVDGIEVRLEEGEWIDEPEVVICSIVHEYQQVQMQACDSVASLRVRVLDDGEAGEEQEVEEEEGAEVCLEEGEWIDEPGVLICCIVHEYQQVQMQASDSTALPPVRYLNDEWSRRKYGPVAMLMTHVGPVRVSEYVPELHGPWVDAGGQDTEHDDFEEDCWDTDDMLLAEMEAREDAESGCDRRNDDTFGAHCVEWCEMEHVLSAQARQAGVLVAQVSEVEVPAARRVGHQGTQGSK